MTRARRDEGFTLLEVLIAFAIFAIVLVSVYNSLATSLQSEAASRQVVTQTETARSILAELGHAIPLAAGERTGREADESRWSLIMTPASSVGGNRVTGEGLQMFRVDLTLTGDDGTTTTVQRLMLGQADGY